MILPILFVALFATSSAAWNLLREISPASEDSLGIWTLDTGSGPRWSLPAGGEIHWSCAEAGARDSLLLPLPVEAAGCTLDVAVALEGLPGQLRCQVAWMFEDGTSQPVALRDQESPPHDTREAGWIVSPETVHGRTRVSPSPTGVLVRVAASRALDSPVSIKIGHMRVHDGSRAVSLAPTPLPIDVTADSAPPSAWRLPVVTGARWRLEASMGLPASWVARVLWPMSSGGRAAAMRLLWHASGTDQGWLPADIRPTAECEDALVGLIERPGTDDSLLTLALEVKEGGPVHGVSIHARPRLPGPGDLGIVQVMCAPAQAEFVEIANRLPWPLSLPPFNLEVNGEVCACGEMNVSASGSFVIRRADCPGMVVPNDEARIRLVCCGEQMDEIIFGPGRPAPAPPYGWSLRRDSVYAMERSPMPGPRRVASVTAHGKGMGTARLTELVVWPVASPNRFIEVAHQSGDTVRLEGWALLCEGAFVFPEGATLAPGGVLTVEADALPPSFALNPDAGELTLVDASGFIVDRVHWTSAPPLGQALYREVAHPEEPWVPGPPTPGMNVRSPLACDVQVTVTGEGRVLQWQCAQSSEMTFLVYRATAAQPDRRDQVSTLPLGGSPPFSFVDIDAEPLTAYLYWICARGPEGEVSSFGPVLSPPNAEPIDLRVGPATPNPFRSTTTVPYSISGIGGEAGRIALDFETGHRMRLGVYTMGGGLVKEFETDRLQDGSFRMEWDGLDGLGRLCPPGVYVVSLQVGPWVRSARVVFAGQ